MNYSGHCARLVLQPYGHATGTKRIPLRREQSREGGQSAVLSRGVSPADGGKPEQPRRQAGFAVAAEAAGGCAAAVLQEHARGEPGLEALASGGESRQPFLRVVGACRSAVVKE